MCPSNPTPPPVAPGFTPAEARALVDAIWKDLGGRGGWGFDDLRADVHREIMDTLTKIALKHMNRVSAARGAQEGA